MRTTTFKQLNISKNILNGLTQMGIEEATPVQSEAIEPMMQGQDVTVLAPTGTGKTCAFGIPIIEAVNVRSKTIQSLVLCPTRELALQTTQALKNMAKFVPGVKIVTIYGGENIEKQMAQLRRFPQIVVATPGRMIDHIHRRTIKLSDLSIVVLDEADLMLDMGFREELDEILKTVPEKRQTVLFSATMSKDIKRIAEVYQKESVLIQVGEQTKPVDTVSQYYTEIKGKTKMPTLVQLLQQQKFKLSLVFVGTKFLADDLATRLSDSGFKAAALHGDLRQRQRDAVMDRYRKGLVDILVATDVAARGIDISNIDAVINYDIPQDCESYIHRIGRTGRAKKKGVAYTFIYPKERGKMRSIIEYTKSGITPIGFSVQGIDFAPKGEDVMLKLEKTETKSVKKAVQKRMPTVQLDDLQDARNVRMFISIGKFDDMKPKQMIKLISDNSDISAKEIGHISMYKQYSFFEIPPKYATDVIANLCGKQHNERTITVELANKQGLKSM